MALLMHMLLSSILCASAAGLQPSRIRSPPIRSPPMSMVLNERAPSVARKARQEFAAAVSEVQALTKPSTPLETQQRQLIDLLIAQVSANDKGFADEVADLDKRGPRAP